MLKLSKPTNKPLRPLQLHLFASQFASQIGLKTKALQQKTQEQEELEEASAHPFPQDVRFWTKEDVGHFLVTLGLQQYRAAFAEAAVDGDFLLALNANDCADVLGVEHVLHSKKLFLAIDKLRPLSGPELQKKVGCCCRNREKYLRSFLFTCLLIGRRRASTVFLSRKEATCMGTVKVMVKELRNGI